MAARKLVVLLIAVLGALTACTATGHSTETTSSTAAVAAPQDPLTEVDDITSSDFVDGHLPPVLHEQGVGSGKYSIDRPAGARSIRFYVSCSPDGRFRVTMGTAAAFYSGPCASRFGNTGQIPLRAGSGPMKVTVDVPSGVRFWILALPVEGAPAGS